VSCTTPSRVRSRIVDELFAVLECTLAPLMAWRPRGFELDVHESDPVAGFVGIGLRLNDYAGYAPTGCPRGS
jgi:hypothetical protein